MTITATVNYVATPYGNVGISVTVGIAIDSAITKVDIIRYGDDGSAIYVRSGNPAELEGGFADYIDREAPFDVGLTYEVRQVTPPGPLIQQSNAVRIDSHKMSLLRDPTDPSGYLPLHTLTSIVDITRAARATSMDILGRAAPIVVSTLRSTGAGTLVFHTATDFERATVTDLCSSGRVLLLSVPADYAQPNNVYLAADDVIESRVGLAMEPARRWTVPFQVVDRPTSYPTDRLAPTWATVYATFVDWNDVHFINEAILSTRSWAQVKAGSP